MATRGGISVSRAGEIETAICEILMESVAAGEVVQLRGFGTFRRGRLAGDAWDPQRKTRVGRDRFRPKFKGTNLEANAQRSEDAK